MRQKREECVRLCLERSLGVGRQLSVALNDGTPREVTLCLLAIIPDLEKTVSV